jgi:uncharacterized membrane protein HdeD (DUF308 family)
MTDTATAADSGTDRQTSDIEAREWKALAGIAAVMFGSGFSALHIESTYLPIVFGLVALSGGILIIEQVGDRGGEP